MSETKKNWVVRNWEDSELFTGTRPEAIRWCKRYGDVSCEVFPKPTKRNPNPEPVYGNWHLL